MRRHGAEPVGRKQPATADRRFGRRRFEAGIGTLVSLGIDAEHGADDRVDEVGAGPKAIFGDIALFRHCKRGAEGPVESIILEIDAGDHRCAEIEIGAAPCQHIDAGSGGLTIAAPEKPACRPQARFPPHRRH